MVELWRSDSWAAPLLGDELQLLRTDTDAEGFGGGPGPGSAADAAAAGKVFPSSCGAAIRTRAGMIPSGVFSRSRAPAAALGRPEPVLRGAACRSSGAPFLAVPIPPSRLASVSAPQPGSSDRGRKSASPAELAANLFLPESSVFAWDDDTSLPLETSWMFDSSAEPPEELVELCAGGVESTCGEVASEPAAPQPDIPAKSTTETSGSVSACSEAGDCARSKEPHSSPDKEDAADCSPEGSTDTTNTTALNLLRGGQEAKGQAVLLAMLYFLHSSVEGGTDGSQDPLQRLWSALPEAAQPGEEGKGK
eukprot:scaffold237031_cov34-Prasinocladus_malaysianus.AAC.2